MKLNERLIPLEVPYLLIANVVIGFGAMALPLILKLARNSK